MNILVTGGTGFIGRHLVKALLSRQHTVVLFSRCPDKAHALFDNQVTCVRHFHDIRRPIDVVINLAGEPIIDKRWSKKRKNHLRSSRIDVTRHLVHWMAEAEVKPRVLISGSAVGYYGNHPEDESLDESAKSHHCFPATLCGDWEIEASRAKVLGTRVCFLRTGVVLGKKEGALKKMWLPFKMGLGGNVGSGKQWFSWIHINDMVGLIIFLMEKNTIEGAVNAVAPEPVTYNRFTRAFAKVLSRPHFFPMPAFILKLLLGESSQLLTEGQKVVPKVLLDAGFRFEFSDIDSALEHIVKP